MRNPTSPKSLLSFIGLRVVEFIVVSRFKPSFANFPEIFISNGKLDLYGLITTCIGTTVVAIVINFFFL